MRLGADGIVVSNHGGRQLDGAIPTARALPRVADAVGDDLTVLADSGVRSGVDVIRLLALGAKGVLLGRAYIYALAAAGEAGVAHLLRLFAEDMKVTMTLTGAPRPPPSASIASTGWKKINSAAVRSRYPYLPDAARGRA